METAANKVNGVQVDIPEHIKGNDWIQSIKLTGVTEIPDYAFDSCENLQSVILGRRGKRGNEEENRRCAEEAA